MRQLFSILLCSSLVVSTTGCASAWRTPVATGPSPTANDTRNMADYVQRLPAGSKVRVERTDGSSLRGTLMRATGEVIVVQRNTRIPEPPIDVPIAQLARVTTETGGTSTGKVVAIAIASGLGAFLTILAMIGAGN